MSPQSPATAVLNGQPIKILGTDVAYPPQEWVPPTPVPGAASAAANKFREVGRTTENPTPTTTNLLAEGLTSLGEAVRELDAQIESLRRDVTSAAE